MKLALRLGICAVAFRRKAGKTEFLLLHRVLHWTGWEFPKGGLKKNESLEKALFRELAEETGISRKEIISFKRIPAALEFDDFVRLKRHKNKAFLAEIPLTVKVRVSKNPDREHSGFRWVSKSQALKMLSFKDQKAVFKKALGFID